MYIVHVIIENKPNISDPEGDTILNDLVLKSKNSSIKKIRAGKILKFTVEASDKNNAEKPVESQLKYSAIFWIGTAAVADAKLVQASGATWTSDASLIETVPSDASQAATVDFNTGASRTIANFWASL